MGVQPAIKGRTVLSGVRKRRLAPVYIGRKRARVLGGYGGHRSGPELAVPVPSRGRHVGVYDDNVLAEDCAIV